jgi:ABC-type multidrug transport system fused ATPase/permease subunit
VVVMVAGRLAERGPPQELLDGRCGDGLFASLVRHDARGQAWVDSRHSKR